MGTTTQISLQTYLTTVYEPDVDYVDGVLEERNVGEYDHNVVQMAASLGMEVVAEGIETAYQAELLKREACETGQGFLFSRPLTASDAENFCRSEVAILV